MYSRAELDLGLKIDLVEFVRRKRKPWSESAPKRIDVFNNFYALNHNTRQVSAGAEFPGSIYERTAHPSHFWDTWCDIYFDQFPYLSN